jgi:hypothetical protein
MRGTLLLVLFSMVCIQPAIASDVQHSSFREELEEIRLNSKLTVQLRDGTQVSGLLAEKAEEEVTLWVEPEKESVDDRNGWKVMRHVPYADVARILTPSEADPLDDLRHQGYLYGGATGRVTYGGTLLEFGGGFDWLVYEGLGLGVSLGIAGGEAGAAVFPSFDVSYHFIPDSPGIVPFVMVGVGAIGVGEAGAGASTTLNVGGGVNIWSGGGMAFRIQVRGRYDTEYDEHTVALQLGVTF